MCNVLHKIIIVVRASCLLKSELVKKSISGVVELSWQRAIFLIFNSLGIYFFFLSAKNGNMAMRER